jgi:protein-disulfide isomerase
MSGNGCEPTLPLLPDVSVHGGAVRAVILESDHVLGEADAPLTVVQYENYQSADCGRFARQEFETIKQQYIDTGQVRWVFRHFPQSSLANSESAAIAAECAADQDLFFEYRGAVYADTDSDGNTILTDDELRKHAETLGMDLTAYDDCVGGEGKTSRIDQDVNSGNAFGVTAVPAFIIDDERGAGFVTAEKLGQIIDRHLSAK